MTRGLVLGKFLPPHAGHVYLVEFARRWVDDLTVVVGTLASEPIPGAVRFGWMQELFPSVRVVHLTDENPQAPDEHPGFWEIWRASLSRVLPAAPDFVFASEPYGAKLAEVLGAEFVPVDLERSALAVSGTAVRDDPLLHWAHLPHNVRPWFLRRVSVFGPESTGKSTLARRLAEHYQTRWVPEYARTLLEHRQGALAARDLERIARGQVASEDALAQAANRLLVCDTDPLLTVVWSEALYGDCPETIQSSARERRYDLTLLCDVDVPWVADPVRYLPDERRSFFERCERALASQRRRFVRIQGDFTQRFAAARAAIDSMLEEKRR